MSKFVCRGDVGYLEIINNRETVICNKEYNSQGYYYKNKKIYEEQKKLTKEEFDKLPLYKKIAYVPEYAMHTFREKRESEEYKKKNPYTTNDYESYFSIKEEVEAYIGEDLHRFTRATIEAMVDDVFETLDWQSSNSLIFGDEYLESEIDDIIEEYESKISNEEELIE